MHEHDDRASCRGEDHQEAQRCRPARRRPSRARRVACGCRTADIERRAAGVAGSKLAIIKSEVDILKSVEHPYIVRCFDAIDSPDKMYLVMEMCAATHTCAACAAPQPVPRGLAA